MLQAVCTYFNGLNKINVEVSELYFPAIWKEFVPLIEVFHLVPVIKGFTSAAAIIIGFGQIKVGTLVGPGAPTG